ncbi:hypothetical protein Ddye_001003 [Dipteronia dyeriana]|uniref:Reverse transcriptase zinc-binding domain-containing protein n=1 Tax=Dipteronia dyeriana TaxID=168575 RepID=A0AAD9XMN4_9ROSI|nr:hypothetical protein Ddye_001003 [Dipteronia dyeriana]
MLGENSTVRSLISPTGGWNSELIRVSFVEEEADAILSLPLAATSTPDSMVWHFDNTGEYTVRSGYIMGCDVLDSPTTSGLNDAASWWKLLWWIDIPLKVKLFVWRACNNWIPTMVNLEGRGLRVSSRCSVCDYGCETTWHALWGCKKLKLVRESILVAQNIGSGKNLQFIDFI